MQGDFLIKVRVVYNQFTKAEKKVADYTLQHPKDVLLVSVTDLAEACDVGDTSVLRFCKTMNLKGYQEFKVMLSLSLHGGDGKDMERLADNISLEDSFEELSQKVLNTDINALTETFSLLNTEHFLEAIGYLGQADRICFFGVGASLLTTPKATNKFLRIEPKMYCMQDSHMQVMMASMMKKKDVAVLFSYSGVTKDTIRVTEVAKKTEAKVVCVTRFVKSPLTSYAGLVLLRGANEGPLQGGPTSAEIGQLSLIDLMYSKYYRRYFDACSKNNEKTSASVLEKLC